jgi:hypothetical protein
MTRSISLIAMSGFVRWKGLGTAGWAIRASNLEPEASGQRSRDYVMFVQSQN